MDNFSTSYYQLNKERLQKKFLERYQNFSEQEKKWQYGRKQCKNRPEHAKK